MPSPKYTVLIANRRTGAVRRLTLSRRVALLGGGALVALPLLMVTSMTGANRYEMATLAAANDSLRAENESFRVATGELADQIATLQSTLGELTSASELDPETRAAIERLPAVVRSRAAGGGSIASGATKAATSPESTFGILRGLLGVIETRLASVRSDIEQTQALGRATPTMWPVAGWLTSRYGMRRDPFTGENDFHSGLDISANRGTPVRATADGVIESAGYQGNYGNAILVEHGFGIATRYGHLSGYAVRVGQRVKRGDVIGYVGSTGRATSSHLHYEILVLGQPFNPLRLLTRP
jgi:murein DD-endopeptidase MepM/ murein hydrolase activator NlpD